MTPANDLNTKEVRKIVNGVDETYLYWIGELAGSNFFTFYEKYKGDPTTECDEYENRWGIVKDENCIFATRLRSVRRLSRRGIRCLGDWIEIIVSLRPEIFAGEDADE